MADHASTDVPIILVVDDDDSVRDSVVDLLAAHGYAAVGADDGQHALELLHAGLRPCLILLDLRMPRKDGLAFRHAQATEPELADIPTVIVSATDIHEQFANLVGVLPKPMPVGELLRVVSHYCSASPS